MRAASVAAAGLVSLAATPLAARDLTLSLPIDCELGTTCYIQHYVDHDPTERESDFRCGTLTYDTHRGTDFALVTLKQFTAGVDVLAASAGTVHAVRDTLPDKVFNKSDTARIQGQGCGNGVRIDHGDGWQTLYCHLKSNSISVAQGEKVSAGTVLGQVGLSGRTQFPHLHMAVFQGEKVVDPFHPRGPLGCGTPSADALWKDALSYRPGGVLSVGFAEAVPTYDAVKAGTAHSAVLPQGAAAIVIFGYAFGGRQGDVMRMRIEGPGGVVLDKTVLIESNHVRFFRAVGRKQTSSLWPKGTYRGTVDLIRDGESIDTGTRELEIP